MTMSTLIRDITLTSIGVGALTLIALSPVIANAAEAPASMPAHAEKMVEAEKPVATKTVSKGTFKGKSRHKTSGGVSVVQTDAGYELVLADTFSLDGAPTPVLGFGSKRKYDKSTTFAALKKISGSQTYLIPSNIAVNSYTHVYVWCEDFSIPLGIAELSQ